MLDFEECNETTKFFNQFKFKKLKVRSLSLKKKTF